VWRYEIMPWPDRVFNSRHPLHSLPASKSVSEQDEAPIGTGLGGFGRGNPNVERVGIPKSYETELQAVITALGDMKQSDVRWESSGTEGMGVLVSDTMMFQRADPEPSDANLGSFYGLAMPLLKRGVPVEPVQIETAGKPGFLNRYKLLVLTYEGQKPPGPEFHTTLAQWVRDGGALVVVDNDGDPYNLVREWWNTAPLSFRTPREHLFQALRLPGNATGLHRVGRGVVVRRALSPAALTHLANGAEQVREAVRQAAAAIKLPLKECNSLVLRRGPYIVAAGLDESLPGAASYVLRGRYINLFDAQLPIVSNVTVAPGARMLLLDLNKIQAAAPKVVAAACRVRDEKADADSLEFRADGIGDTNAVVQIASRTAPVEVLVGGQPLDHSQYDYQAGLLRLGFPNAVEPIPIRIRFRK
jgi:hypothetical protein